MKKKALVQILQRVANEITEHISAPNFGGCAVVAAIVGHELAKHTQVKVLVQDYNKPVNLIRIRKQTGSNALMTKDDWNGAGVDFNHVLLKVKLGRKWKVFDSDGVVPYVPAMYNRGSLTIDEAFTLAASKDWNRRFNRRQIPMIGRIVHDAFA